MLKEFCSPAYTVNGLILDFSDPMFREFASLIPETKSPDITRAEYSANRSLSAHRRRRCFYFMMNYQETAMIKVIDLGLGRTGTMSLKYALEKLGFDKCYHFSDMHNHLEHTDIWLSVSRGEKVNWESLFEGYQSTVYWSPSYDYLELLKQYPDVKVVLTVRDPEKWYKSMYDTIYKFNRLTFSRKVFLLVMSLFKPELKKLYAMWQLQEQSLWKKTFKGKFHDKKFAIEVFNKHIEEVKKNVPADRLLIYEIQDGWEPLCHFLKTPVPEAPFPRVNDSSSFIAWRKQIFR